MNITAEFYLPSMIPTEDIEHHNINTETSLAVCKIIQALTLNMHKVYFYPKTKGYFIKWGTQENVFNVQNSFQ